MFIARLAGCSKTAHAHALCLSLLLAGCSGGEETGETAEEASSSSGDERPVEHDDGVEISGLMGTIQPDQVQNALTPRMGRFQRCFSQRSGEVELLAGEIRMGFRVHTDGSVAWVHASMTDIGDRETERCILDVARGTRFPRPRGGEAEFSWGFGLDMADDLRPPLTWTAEALGRHSDDLRGLARTCHASGNFTITAYIQPGGAVLAAGGSSPNADAEAALDCVLEAVRGWELEDPGSYPAKIQFAVGR